jgi:hypothetical protein
MFEHDVEKETCSECPIYFSHRLYDFQDNAKKGVCLKESCCIYVSYLSKL